MKKAVKPLEEAVAKICKDNRHYTGMGARVDAYVCEVRQDRGWPERGASGDGKFDGAGG